MAKRTWEVNWERVGPLASGGQGTTSIVRRSGDADANLFVLKVLNKPRDPERRARMLREIQALRGLGPPGIPQIVDSSVLDDGESTLFLVAEFVDGGTLEKAVRESPMNLPDALDFTAALLATVARCHSASIVHRDIKPDNIVLRGKSPAAPCLIDFGLSASPDDDNLTGSEQQVGNRFLLLPEHATPGSDKRDPRSDLTACCGIMLYALTGRQPMTLMDQQGLKPHERGDVREKLSVVPAPVRVHLARFFDRAFEHQISERWQASDDILAVLRALRDDINAHAKFLAALPSTDPDAWSDVLLWTSEPSLRSYWLTRSNRQFTIQTERPGAFFSGGERVWMWEQVSTPVTLSNQDDVARMFQDGLSFEDVQQLPKVAGHVDSARLVDIETGVVAGVSTRLMGDYGGAWTMLSDTISPTFSAGCVLFAEQHLAGLPLGAAHPMYGANFACIDLGTGHERSWAEPLELKAFVALLGNDAVSRLSEEPASWWDDHQKPSVDDLSVTKYDATYSDDGSLHLNFQLTASVPYAFGDGAWGAYSRSATVRSANVPALLEGFRRLPEVVRWFVGMRGHRRFGWTALDSARRDVLLKAFRERKGIPGLIDYSLHRV